MDIVYYEKDTEEHNGPLVVPTQKSLFEYINKALNSDGKNSMFYFWTKQKTGPYAPNYDNYSYMKGGSIITPFGLFSNKVQIGSVVTAERLEIIENFGIDSKHYYMINIDGVYSGPLHYDCGKFYDAQNHDVDIANKSINKIITVEDFIEKMKGVYIPADKKKKDDEPATEETVVDSPVVDKTDTLAVVNSIINGTEDEDEADNVDDAVNTDNSEEVVETVDESQENRDIYNEYLNGSSYSNIAKKYNKNMSEVFKIILEEKELVNLEEN